MLEGRPSDGFYTITTLTTNISYSRHLTLIISLFPGREGKNFRFQPFQMVKKQDVNEGEDSETTCSYWLETQGLGWRSPSTQYT